MSGPIDRGPVDDDGFVDLAALRRYLTRGGAIPSAPAIRVKAVTAAGDAGGDDLSYRRTVDSTRQTDVSTDTQRYVGAVAFLTKRPGNPFPHMVTVGRATNSDIRISLPAVSKVQAYFVTDGAGWDLVDQRSRNGTFVNGERIPSGQRRTLRDGDTLQLGDSLTVEFILPGSLKARVQ